MQETDVAIVGAGPYGLSLAAHLREARVTHRIFGRPMQSWQNNMPRGMFLKSDGYASTLYDPNREFTLERFCKEQGIAYQSVGMPIPLDTFVAYGLEFQRRMVPHLEPVEIESVRKQGSGFLLRTSTGEEVLARRVVLAVGITHFGVMPPQLQGLPPEAVTHSYGHGDVRKFTGKRVLVVGAGASAVDTAAALADVGVDVSLIGRRPKIGFHDPELDPRPLHRRVLRPRSGLGFGWKYVVCVDAPYLFRALPQQLRHRVVRRHLGPSPGWFMKEKVQGRIPMLMSAQITSVDWDGSKVRVIYDQPGKPGQEFIADHLIAATGYKPLVPALRFLDPELAGSIRTEEGTPLLSRTFQTSVPGLHMIGLAASNCFGPAHRFAIGAKFTSRFLSRHLARKFARTAPFSAGAPALGVQQNEA